MKSYLNLQNKIFVEPEIGSWYNLSTNHIIKKLPNKFDDFILLDSPRIAGNKKMIDQFHCINKEYTYSFDIEKIPKEKLDMLYTFSLSGIKNKARVLNIIDGDTLSVAFFIPMEHLINCKTAICKDLELKNNYQDFCVKMNVRINEIDTAEKNTNKGILAKQLLENIIQRLNGYIFIHIIKYEKYGRLLADLYEDDKYTINIKNNLLDYSHPILGKVCVPYFGNKKISWPKSPEHFNTEMNKNITF